MNSVWGPWIVHHGNGCPLPAGTIVEVVFEDRFGYKNKSIGCTDGSGYSSWDWSYYPELKKIIRYREKKPKALEHLREMVASLDDGLIETPSKETQKGRPLPAAP